jgi:hypothetical protein
MVGLPCSLQQPGRENPSWMQYHGLHFWSIRWQLYALPNHIIDLPNSANKIQAVISYFQDAVLNTAGIHDTTTKLNITLSISCSSFIIALIGAACVDRVGRRPLLLFTNFSCACVWIGISVATGIYAYHGGVPDASVVVPADARPAGIAALVMIYIFGFVYSFGFTPLQALYPVEVLSFEMRAKGMAFSNFAVSAASLINQFALPVSLKEITWKTYIIFVVWDFFQTASIYFFIPETKNRTVRITNTPSPMSPK